MGKLAINAAAFYGSDLLLTVRSFPGEAKISPLQHEKFQGDLSGDGILMLSTPKQAALPFQVEMRNSSCLKVRLKFQAPHPPHFVSLSHTLLLPLRHAHSHNSLHAFPGKSISSQIFPVWSRSIDPGGSVRGCEGVGVQRSGEGGHRQLRYPEITSGRWQLFG